MGGFSSISSSGFGSLASTQGSAFSSSPFAAGPTKLSSFAAPTGDAKLGSTTIASAKPFGAPAEEGDESDEGSEVASDEGEERRGEYMNDKNDWGGEAVDHRFHKQESKPSGFFSCWKNAHAGY